MKKAVEKIKQVGILLLIRIVWIQKILIRAEKKRILSLKVYRI